MVSSKGKKAAGILLYYNDKNRGLMIFLAHHGGPEWEGYDTGAWDIPKGEIENGENDFLLSAKREFFEETGIKLNENGNFNELGSTVNKWGKEIFIWAYAGKGDEKFISSNHFEMEWPKGSGKIGSYPEMDKGQYFDLKDVKIKGHSYIQIFVKRLEEKLKENKDQKKLF